MANEQILAKICDNVPKIGIIIKCFTKKIIGINVKWQFYIPLFNVFNSKETD